MTYKVEIRQLFIKQGQNINQQLSQVQLKDCEAKLGNSRIK